MTNLPIRSKQRLEQQQRISKLKMSIQAAIAEINGIDPALTTAEILSALNEVAQSYLADCLDHHVQDAEGKEIDDAK